MFWKGLNKMKRLIFLLSTLALILALVPAGMTKAKKPAPSLTGTIDCDFDGSQMDDENRTLVWNGTIIGEINGRILWWIDFNKMVSTGKVSHYVARWEIWDIDPIDDPDDAVLLLAGDDAGTTTTPPGKDGIWQGNGIVTEASGDFEDWIGRHVYEHGSVYYSPEGDPVSGDGTFRIN